MKVEIDAIIEGERIIQLFPYGETNQEHCVHGIKLRWSCDKCEDELEQLDGGKVSEEEIECINCGTTPGELAIIPNNIGQIWYCSYDCYDEKTKDEG